MPIRVFCFLMLICSVASSALRDYPIWKFEYGGRTSYIVGTFHVRSLLLQEMPELQAIIANADVLVTEPGPADRSTMRSLVRAHGDEGFSEEARSRLEAFLNLNPLGFSGTDLKALKGLLDHLKPQALYGILMSSFSAAQLRRHNGEDLIFDFQIIKQAEGKKRISLDAGLVLPEMMLRVFTSKDVNRAVLASFSADGRPLEPDLDRHVYWEDLKNIENYLKNPEMRRRLDEEDLKGTPSKVRSAFRKLHRAIRGRHDEWVDRILDITAENNAVIAVGYAHVIDSHTEGLASILKKFGRVTPLSVVVVRWCSRVHL